MHPHSLWSPKDTYPSAGPIPKHFLPLLTPTLRHLQTLKDIWMTESKCHCPSALSLCPQNSPGHQILSLNLALNTASWGWRGDSVIKSTCCSGREHGSVPSTHVSAHNALDLQFQSSRASTPSSDLHGHQTRMQCTYLTQAEHSYTYNYS